MTCVGLDRDRPQVVLELHLVEPHLGTVEEARRVLLRADFADDRPLATRGGGEASEAATVDLPTPPLPVTKSSRFSSISGIRPLHQRRHSPYPLQAI